jgi:hypothetical protein
VNVRFLTLAQQEVDEAFQWFEEKAEGKGLEFLDELDRVVRLMRNLSGTREHLTHLVEKPPIVNLNDVSRRPARCREAD